MTTTRNSSIFSACLAALLAGLLGAGCLAAASDPGVPPIEGTHVEVYEDGTHIEVADEGEAAESIDPAAVAGATAGSACSCIWVLGTSHYHCTVNGETRCYGRCP